MSEIISMGLTFNELPEKVQAEIIRENNDINVFDDWFEFLVDHFQEELEKIGFLDSNVMFSGFWNQGDGACFTAKHFDPIKFMKDQKICNRFRILFDNCRLNNLDIYGHIQHGGNYYHENSHTLYLEWDYFLENTKKYDKIYDAMNEFEAYVKEFIHDKAKEIYRELQDDYEYLTSDESIKNTLSELNNEYTVEVWL